MLKTGKLWQSLIFLNLFIPFLAQAATVNFVVAEWPGHEQHYDSYILPLSGADDIAHARDLIANGPGTGASIVVANIAEGADGINRNITQPGEPLWNWHVTSFESFADITAEILDGWPSFVESDVAGWINNTGGNIGFWSYTVVKELQSPVPLPAAIWLFATGVAGLFGFARARKS